MEILKKSVCIALVMSMILAGMVVISDEARGLDVGGSPTQKMAPLPGGVTINDIAWAANGAVALGVGRNDTGGSNAFFYNPLSNSWQPLVPRVETVVMEHIYGPATGGDL